MNNSYRPANGVEGLCFQEAWCAHCARDALWNGSKEYDECGEEYICEIIASTYRYECGDPEYPAEWIYDEHGNPCCTAFVTADGAQPSRCAKTKDMFDEQ